MSALISTTRPFHSLLLKTKVVLPSLRIHYPHDQSTTTKLLLHVVGSPYISGNPTATIYKLTELLRAFSLLKKHMVYWDSKHSLPRDISRAF